MNALLAILTHLARRINNATSWCHLIGHNGQWTGTHILCRQCGRRLGP